MRLLFIRHAIAEDKTLFLGEDDLLRPLIPKGIEKASLVAEGLASFYPTPDHIFSSPATRAEDTAKIFSEAFHTTYTIHEALQPGCNTQLFKQLIAPYYHENETIMVIGHEPDFSFIISALVSSEDVAINIKKASCIEIEIDEHFYGVLNMVIPPKLILHFLKSAERATL